MRTQPMSMTDTILFRLAQALLPEAMLLALFGRRVRVPVARDSRAAMRRR